MKIIISAILVFAISFISDSVPAAQIHLDEEISAIPSKITDIYNCGSWKTDNAEGFFRVIYIEFYYGNSLLYIQWIQDFTFENDTRHTLYTLSIDEFNADDHIELTFDKPECIETRDGIRFHIEADSGHDLKQHVFDLQIHQAFGQYSTREIRKQDKDLSPEPAS